MSNKQFLHTEIVNKRATFSYELLDKYVAGMLLTGTEIKSIREGKANLGDAYCVMKKQELWVKNLHISEYKLGTYSNHDPIRWRKLLLTKRELYKLEGKVKEKGLTLIPTRLFISERGFAKLEFYLAKGKKTHDKRESLKAKDSEREMGKMLKKYK